MYVRHLLVFLLLATISTGTTGGAGVMAASFTEDEDDSSETVGSLEQAFSLYPDDWTTDGTFPSRPYQPLGGNSDNQDSLLLLLQQDKSRHRLVDDLVTGTEDTLELDGGRTSTSTSSFYSSSTAPVESQEAKGKPVRSATLTAAIQPLTRVSDFFRSMLERFGVVSPVEIYQSPSPGLDPAIPELSTERSRLRSYRYRPHFVSTAKGLRNIPAQLNDGQLVHAPDDATDRPVAPLSTAPVNRRPAGTESPVTVGRPPSTTTSSSTIKNLFNSFKRKVKAIYPGTVWCGDGNQAKSEDDIGFFYLTDSCCRAHDLCPITIAAGEQFNRLRNNGHFTRSHCDCDKQFYNCLKNADTLVSRQVGYTYFNLLKPQCFRYEHPKVSCTKKKKGKCLSYVVDEQQSKQWQWFDNLIF